MGILFYITARQRLKEHLPLSYTVDYNYPSVNTPTIVTIYTMSTA